MKQNRKEQNNATPLDDSNFESSMDDSSNILIPGSSISVQWSGTGLQQQESNSNGPKSVVRHGPPSDCTSMSADSPGSRQSVMTGQRSTVSNAFYICRSIYIKQIY